MLRGHSGHSFSPLPFPGFAFSPVCISIGVTRNFWYDSTFSVSLGSSVSFCVILLGMSWYKKKIQKIKQIICRFYFLLLARDFSVLRICFIVRRNRSSASDSSYGYTFLRPSVCRSVVCHIRAPCLNRSTDSDAIWQIHLRGLMTHCARSGSWLPGDGEVWGQTPSQTYSCKLLLSPGEYDRGVGWTAIPRFTKLLWCLFCIVTKSVIYVQLAVTAAAARIWCVRCWQPLSTVAHETPGASNISLFIVRSMGTYANVTVYFQVNASRSVNDRSHRCNKRFSTFFIQVTFFLHF